MKSVAVGLALSMALAAQDSPFSQKKPGKKPAGPSPAAPRAASSESKKKPQNTAAAVKAGLEWLARNQQADGSWNTVLGGRAGLITVTSFCALSLIASGVEEYRPLVDKAAQFVSGNLFGASNPIGGQWDQTNWQFAIGGMFLCEYWKQNRPAEGKPKNVETKAEAARPEPAKSDDGLLQKIVDEIVKRIEPSGGWGHGPHVKNALNYLELEVMSNFMLATLGMARKLGAKVPGETIGKATRFVEECCNPGQGAVGYSPNPGQKGIACPCRTGGAIFGFAQAGQTGHPLFGRMIEAWKRIMKNSGEGHGSLAMGLLESALGARQIGPDAWDQFVGDFFPLILSHANADGSFKHIQGKTMMSVGGDGMTGPAYPTGVLTLIMQLDLGHLRFLGQRTN
jgi:hypothetical protein